MIENRRVNHGGSMSVANVLPELPPPDVRATRMKTGEQAVVVFSYPAGSTERSFVERLTFAERGVLELLLEGKTNARIAQARGTTLRTVSKQVDSVYKKLEVHSRGELAARYGAKREG